MNRTLVHLLVFSAIIAIPAGSFAAGNHIHCSTKKCAKQMKTVKHPKCDAINVRKPIYRPGVDKLIIQKPIYKATDKLVIDDLIYRPCKKSDNISNLDKTNRKNRTSNISSGTEIKVHKTRSVHML